METTHERKVWIKLIMALFILKILKEGPSYGNQISEVIKQITQNTVKPNPNFIYPLLRQMEKDGHVEGTWENPQTRNKRTYTITASGLRYFEQLKKKVQVKFLEIERRHKAIRSYIFNETDTQGGL